MKTLLKIILWAIMAIILAGAAALICTVKLLTPDRLTPIAQKIANDFLAADVSLGRVALEFNPAFPILRVSVDSVAVVSKAFSNLSPDQRQALPQYADTVITFDSFSGAIGLDRLIRKGEIALSDVVLRGPAINIVIASDSLYNYDLLAAAPQDTTESASEIPPFSIDRFRIEDARAIRYFNAVDSTGATVLLLSDAGIDGTQAPAYRIKIDGNLRSPLARSFVDIENISFGADGKVRWDPSMPAIVALEQFNVSGAFLSATVDTEVDLGNNMTVRSATLDVQPIPLDSLLILVPADVRARFRLSPPYLATDARIALSASLTRPFNLTTDTIPAAQIDIRIPDAPLAYGRMKLRTLALDLGLSLAGNNLDSAILNVRRFEAAGPATTIKVHADVDKFISDPRFDACVKIKSDLALLPPIVADIAGGYISGIVDADIDIQGRQSMFAPAEFHRLDVRGSLDAHKLYFLRNDTNLMAEVMGARLRFGSDIRLKTPDSTRQSARTLAASVRLDSANILTGGIDLAIGKLSLGVGVENTGMIGRADSTIVLPMGGGIKVSRFNVTSVTDSAGMRLRDLAGHIGIRRFRGKDKFPQFNLDVTARRITAGAPAAKVMLLDPKITVEAHKLLSRRMSKKLRNLADSLARIHPELSPDSVIRLAIEKRRHRPGEKVRHRVHTELSPQETQMLEWGTTNAFRKLLLDWDLRGRISTRKARLFTPHFPLRNRISNVDIAFSTDSIVLTDIRYKGGRSDITINGIVSNIRRGFTSSGYRSPIKANLRIASRKIDVNELAAATFAGAAYAERVRRGGDHHHHQLIGITGGLGSEADDEDALDRELQALTDTTATGPLLIPTNIDAQIHVIADSIFYSDLRMSGLSGDVLMYNGALNLHDLRCTSDIGSLTLDALYSAPSPRDMKFGFGLDARRFDINRFLRLVPAIDSIMPLMRDFGGIISADIAATCDVDSSMNLVLPSLDAAVRLEGDSLTFIDSKTYRTIGKWLGFKDKDSNVIKHLDVEMTVSDDILRIFPFMLDIDRYRIGVQGYNDLDMNFDYHLAVLKSPLPFKFGITVKGNPDKYKVRFGGPKFKADAPAASIAIVDTARVNLISQIQNIFRRGVSASRFARINTPATTGTKNLHSATHEEEEVALTHADSLALIREGMLEAPLSPDEIRAKQQASADDHSADRSSGKEKKAPRPQKGEATKNSRKSLKTAD